MEEEERNMEVARSMEEGPCMEVVQSMEGHAWRLFKAWRWGHAWFARVEHCCKTDKQREGGKKSYSAKKEIKTPILTHTLSKKAKKKTLPLIPHQKATSLYRHPKKLMQGKSSLALGEVFLNHFASWTHTERNQKKRKRKKQRLDDQS